MSDKDSFSFGKFVPGFDFLQNLAKGASQTLPQMPSLANWVAPTLNIEELEKRIGELRAVHFWLNQNSNALSATIQALEVQKMTLAALKGMNFNMGDVADAFKLKTPHTKYAGKQPATSAGADAGIDAGVVDPLQWWGALTQQFQQIAASAMQEAAAQSVETAKNMASAAKASMNSKAGSAGARTRRAAAPQSSQKSPSRR